MENSRRLFIKQTSVVIAATGMFPQFSSSLLGQTADSGRADLQLYNGLLEQWCNALVDLQSTDISPVLKGGFMCPSCKFIHGRSADAVLPLLYMADRTQKQKYLDAAIRVYDWAEYNVSQPDGSWINDLGKNPWKGITIFGASALAESLKHYSHLLDIKTRDRWFVRLEKACDFIYGFITPETSNINYPLCASYPLVLGGKLLKQQRFVDKGVDLAQLVYQYLSPIDGFIYGELKPRTQSARGFWPVDLTYNVEETLPTLTLYALEMRDEKMIDTLVRSWKTHLEFLLPDGAWDNSFGTRNHKWTYWGSRNSDGCQAGLALLGERDAVLTEAAYRNALLLKRCTHEGILYGGPGYLSHGVKPCIHHNFAHAKSLAVLLGDKNVRKQPFTRLKLPREEIAGIKIFKDIGTHLLSSGKWRATVTANDTEYRVSPHASGGSLALLYHTDLGLILTDSLFPELPLRERSNMQGNPDPLQLLLTPRLEMRVGKTLYRSSRDLGATVVSEQHRDNLLIKVQCRLLSHDLEDAPGGIASFEMEYLIGESGIKLTIRSIQVPVYDDFAFYLPVVSPRREKFNHTSGTLIVHKTGGDLKITTSGKILVLGKAGERVFSQSPGVEAIPVKIEWDTRTSKQLVIDINA